MGKKLGLNEKLDIILDNQKKILKNERKILGEEEKILDEEEKLEDLENKEIAKEDEELKDEEQVLKELSDLERDLKKSITNPIKKITKRDVVKGFIGAFFGVVGHFAFSKAVDVSKEISFFQATILYVVSFMIVIIMLYYSGFRNIEKKIILKFMPLRALVLYSVSIVTIIFVYSIFGKIHYPVSFDEMYRMVGAGMVLAVLGAGTADLIGRNE